MPPSNTQSVFGELPSTPTAGAPGRKPKILIVVIAGLALLAAIFVILAVVTGGPGPSERLGRVVANQNEIIRLIDEYDDRAGSVETQAFLARTKAVLTSHSARLTEYSGRPDKAITAQAAQPEAEEELKQASQNNRIDEVSETVITGLIQENLELIEQVQRETSAEELKTLLQEVYDNQRALIT